MQQLEHLHVCMISTGKHMVLKISREKEKSDNSEVCERMNFAIGEIDINSIADDGGRGPKEDRRHHDEHLDFQRRLLLSASSVDS